MKKVKRLIMVLVIIAVVCVPVRVLAAGNGVSKDVILPFQDVPQNAWYYDNVKWVYANEIMTGMTDTTFGPVTNLSRAQFAVMLYRMEGSPKVRYEAKFPDVESGNWYSEAITWANQNRIVTGYIHNGMFGISDDITREQLAAMLYRYAAYKGLDVTKQENPFWYPDAYSTSGFAFDAVSWILGEGIITGDSGMINPQGIVNRAVAATMLTRLNRNVLLEDLDNGYFYIGNQKVHFDFPESWKNKFEVIYAPSGIEFYCSAAHGMDEAGTFWPGTIFSVHANADTEADLIPVADRLGEKDGLYYYSYRVTDVQYDYTSAEKREAYISMSEEWEYVRDSMEFVDEWNKERIK